MGAHLVGGQFQSDKYPSCPPGKVPLSVRDRTAQDLLWEYAQRRRVVDAEFADDLEAALRAEGFQPGVSCSCCGESLGVPRECRGCYFPGAHRHQACPSCSTKFIEPTAPV